MIGEEIVVRRATTRTDRYGNEIVDWTTATEYVVAGCAVAPRTSAEDNNGRTAVITGLTVYAVPDAGGVYGWSAGGDPLTTITATDQLQVRGHPYEVIGDVGDWRDPFDATTEGLEIQTERAEG